MDRQDDELALVLFAELFEFRQLLYTGGAVGAPEVDDDDLTFMVGEMELSAVKGGCFEIGQLLPDLIADRGVALKGASLSKLTGSASCAGAGASGGVETAALLPPGAAGTLSSACLYRAFSISGVSARS